MKINDEISIPQIIFDDILAINYEQFEILQEANLLDKISLGKICCHFRFFNKRLVYPNFESNNFLTNEGEEFFLNFQDLSNEDFFHLFLFQIFPLLFISVFLSMLMEKLNTQEYVNCTVYY